MQLIKKKITKVRREHIMADFFSVLGKKISDVAEDLEKKIL